MDVEYSQGMNIITSWILKHMQVVNEGEIVYDTVNSFYILCHIMKVLQCQDIYADGQPGLFTMVEIFEDTL